MQPRVARTLALSSAMRRRFGATRQQDGEKRECRDEEQPGDKIRAEWGHRVCVEVGCVNGIPHERLDAHDPANDEAQHGRNAERDGR